MLDWRQKREINFRWISTETSNVASSNWIFALQARLRGPCFNDTYSRSKCTEGWSKDQVSSIYLRSMMHSSSRNMWFEGPPTRAVFGSIFRLERLASICMHDAGVAYCDVLHWYSSYLTILRSKRVLFILEDSEKNILCLWMVSGKQNNEQINMTKSFYLRKGS